MSTEYYIACDCGARVIVTDDEPGIVCCPSCKLVLFRHSDRVLLRNADPNHACTLRPDYNSLAQAAHGMLGRLLILEQRVHLLEERLAAKAETANAEAIRRATWHEVKGT